MTKKSERQPIKAENVAGGAGYILKEELIKGEQLGAYCKMFNEVTLKLSAFRINERVFFAGKIKIFH